VIVKDTHTIHSVREFHRAFSHPIAKTPCIPTPEVRALRLKLIAEELCELADAWGFSMVVNSHPFDTPAEQGNRVSCVPSPGAVVSLVEAADALGDLDYVVQGANLVAGYPAVKVLAAIQASNMSKLGADGKPVKRADGKIMKGPNYFKPDIAAVLQPYADNPDLDVAQT
jgi:predicted HAD superfamily Cof-like phosphohydrolase